MYRSMQPPNLTPWRLFPGTLPLTIVILAAACGDDPVDAPPVPTTVTISPAMATLVSFEETVQLTATVYDQHGEVMPGFDGELVQPGCLPGDGEQRGSRGSCGKRDDDGAGLGGKRGR